MRQIRRARIARLLPVSASAIAEELPLHAFGHFRSDRSPPSVWGRE